MKSALLVLLFGSMAFAADYSYRCNGKDYSSLEVIYDENSRHTTLVTVDMEARILNVLVPDKMESSDTENPSQVVAICKLDLMGQQIESCKNVQVPIFKTKAEKALEDEKYIECLFQHSSPLR